MRSRRYHLTVKGRPAEEEQLNVHAILHAVFEQRVTSVGAHQCLCLRVESRMNHIPVLLNALRDTPNSHCSSHPVGPGDLNDVRHRGQISIICGTHVIFYDTQGSTRCSVAPNLATLCGASRCRTSTARSYSCPYVLRLPGNI